MEEDSDAFVLWHELVLNSVECGVCNNPYTDEGPHVPRLLPCGHTYCEFCLQDWARARFGSSIPPPTIVEPISEVTPAGTGRFASFAAALNASFQSNSSGDSSTSLVQRQSPQERYEEAGECAIWLECPLCRNMTQLSSESDSIQKFPKNFELLKIRNEMQSSKTQMQLKLMKEKWMTRVDQTENLAKESKEFALLAQKKAEEAALKSIDLAKQVEMNEEEKIQAQIHAEEAKERATKACQEAIRLEAETKNLKEQLRVEAEELQRLQSDVMSASGAATESHMRAEELQKQVDRVKAQLSLHSGRHDPARLVVLVCDPTTVGSWVLPYTRYAVISISTAYPTTPCKSRASKETFKAAKNWIMHQMLIESSAQVRVYRRYSDFLWLYRELCRKHPYELIPGIPRKQILFNKEKEFIGERMKLFQAFLRQILRHPLLSLAEEVRLFLLSTTEELEEIKMRSSGLRVIDADIEFELNRTISSPPMHPMNAQGFDKRSKENGRRLSLKESDRASWAWGAVSAITNTAAKLLNSGSSLTNTETGAAGRDRTKSTLSDSFSLESETTQQCSSAVLLRLKYAKACSSYENILSKGSYIARKERQQARHLHCASTLLNEMELLDRSYDKNKHGQLGMEQNGPASIVKRQEEHVQPLCFETRSFDARAADLLSSFSLLIKSFADCHEYALLEVLRMQYLQLSAIEESFTRIRQRQSTIEEQSATLRDGNGSWDSKQETADRTRRLSSCKQNLLQAQCDLESKIDDLDPMRSQFVLETLQQNVTEMQIMSKERRETYEKALQQLDLA